MNQQQFKKLDAKEKNEFLSNDMSERIMRVEQKVSANFGRLLHYNNTEYYKSLTPVQKESFERLNRENLELKEAIQAILAGETAFKKGRTRTFRQFLKSRLPIYVKSR